MDANALLSNHIGDIRGRGLFIGIELVLDKTTKKPFNPNLIPDNVKKLKASSWMICAFGENEFAAAKLAIRLGGHVHIGFENNSVLEDSTEAENNSALIKQISNHLQTYKLNSADYVQTQKLMTPNW